MALLPSPLPQPLGPNDAPSFNSVRTGDGSALRPSFGPLDRPNTGFWWNTGQLYFAWGGGTKASLAGSGLLVCSTYVLSWTSGTPDVTSPDVGFSRFQPGVVMLGNGTLWDRSASLVLGNIALASVSNIAAYTPTAFDSTIRADSTAAAFNINLPSAADQLGRIYTIKRVNAGANAVTVAPSGGQTIDGAATYMLGLQYQFVTIQSNGVNWDIIGKG